LQMLESHLSDVPRKAFGLLREKKVVWDRQCSPAERVALREINDFAFPVKIKMPSGEEIFWKWYLLDDKQAEQMIAGIYGAEKAIEKEIAPMKKDLTEKQMQTALTPTAALLLAEAEKTEHGKQSEKREDRKELPIEKKEEKHRQKQEGGFEMLVWNFLKKRQLEHIEHKMIKKNKEMNIIIKMPSAIGELYYFIKAKDKKRVNDADLSLAYSESQRHNMPLLFLSGGELTVKAKRLIEEQMKGIAFKKL
ncbi:hypothetical protein HZB88_03935, partial [archaeon]|nr:hypothetical protein [archaeon]